MYAMKRMNNEMAVSPIVATLVLIVVAVIGAVAVGTIMGTFSTQVSKSVNANQASTASQQEILVVGSTTLSPIMGTVATNYMANNAGTKVTVTGGGSGAGVSAVANGVADIGMVSQSWDSSMQTTYPNIKAFTVGYGGVVAIANLNGGIVYHNVTPSQLNLIFTNGTYEAASSNNDADLSGITTVVTRSDISGTADSFATYIGDSKIYDTTHGQVAENGNSGVVGEVAKTSNSIGFTDLDYALTASNISIIPWSGTHIGNATVSEAASGGYGTVPFYTTQPYPYFYERLDETDAALNAAGAPVTMTSPEAFPQGATRPLNLITNGVPTPAVQAFINYAMSGAEQADFHNANLTHITDISKLD